ncbi:MAG: bifunctional 4-hydroxy-2-oxoglutarate aldolase/2-dehydro-3-deoxy-phosphogluconate aldolase [Burkholderiales bacterium]|jgi:2-dehydro-3-deoxyphosphogluconate aldolase/(4S)-4-hydroxy-2-oxoglutarate aldolase
MRSAESVKEGLIATRVVPVLRFDTAEQTRFAIDCLVEAGFGSVELTLTTPGAIGLLAELRSGLAQTFLVGAGTVLNARQARECIDAGADYLVSPCVVREIGRLAHDAGCALLLGAFTPSEVLAAFEEGSDIVKLFPAATGGPSHLAAMKAVFPDVTFCPTGGVNAENIDDWFAAGARLVGVGSSIIDRQAMAGRDRDGAIRSARRYLDLARAQQ